MKLFRRAFSVVFMMAGTVVVASSCSTSSDGSFTSPPPGVTTLPDGATVVITDSGMTIPVVVDDSGMVVVAPGSDASLPPGFDAAFPPPGSDATASPPPGSDATVSPPPGSDATVSPPPGSDATVSPPGSDATTTLADGACPDTGTATTCSATVSGSAIPLRSNYLAATVGIGMGGYAYTYNDSMGTTGGTSTSCVASTALCASGMTDVSNGAATPNHYGAGVGFNLNQQQSTGCTTTPVNNYTVPSGSVGISYALSNLPPGGVRLEIGNAVTSASGTSTGTDYCATLSTASGFIPWAAFNSQCWVNTAGDFLTGVPSAVTHINFGLPSGTSASSFNFCVDSVSFPTKVPDGGTGTMTTTNCNGNSCCEPTSGPDANGNGVFSCYTFKQGTVNNKTFCGYNGSESGYSGGGNGACQAGMLAYNDTVPNIAGNSGYFAAFPSGGAGWGQGAYCGMCVNVTYSGQTLMGTIVDECATCGDSQEHIDLSANLARALGIGVGMTIGDPPGVTWKAVACPITSNGGNIEVVWNSSNQAYFQNVVWPVKSVSGATQTDGFWNVAAGATVTLTDLIGHQITATMPGAGGGSLGKQFPSTCTN